MLEKVVFRIGKDILQENILRGGSVLLDDLRAHGVEVIVETYGDGLSEESGRINPSVMDLEGEETTLYITDSEREYFALRQQGGYVLPCRHEQNAAADFPGALYVMEQIGEVDFEAVDMAYRRLAGIPWEILTTNRCVIRETTEEDVDSFYQIYARPQITKYMEELYADRDEEIAYVKDYRERVYGFYGYGMWTVLLKDGTVIGRAGVSWREGFDLPELGFVIGVPWQRQGYACEVCSAILEYAREELGFTQMQALVMEGNRQSAALCEKLGFKVKGEPVEVEGDIYAVYCRRL